MIPDAPRYLLDFPTARALLRSDAPDGLRLRIRTTRLGSIWISAVTEAALRHDVSGCPDGARLEAALELLLRHLPTVPFDKAAAVACSRLAQRAAHLVRDTPELLNAALALSTESVLVTAEPKLGVIPGLPTENWLVD